MNVDWKLFLQRLASYPERVHRFLPPCPEDRIEATQSQLGKMPAVLVDMLRHFNGARLFEAGIQLVSIFGISPIPPLPPLEWAPEWNIDKYTPAWRSSRKGKNEWVIGIWNYGSLVLLDQDGTVSEWDTAQNMWGPRHQPFNQWLERVLQEGDAFLKEE